MPTLTTRGKLIVASSWSYIVLGAIIASSSLVVIGSGAILSLLAAYLWFFPVTIALRHQNIELSWWMSPSELPGGSCAIHVPLPLHIALRNHSPRRLRVVQIDIVGSSGLHIPKALEAIMFAETQVELLIDLRAQQTGYHVLHGATLRFCDSLGIFDVSAYFPNPLPFMVFPRSSEFLATPPRDLGAVSRQQLRGKHVVHVRGIAGELREIREHQPGDSFRNIAWKATARRRTLMVRDLENEVVHTHQFILDTGSTMREGPAGHRKLDYAIHLVCNLSKIALDLGDRVGLTTFDTRIYSQVAPGDGRQQHTKIVDQLVKVNTIVDEDLTAATNSELIAAIADYLAHQESVDVRLGQAPPLNSPKWATIQAGPHGELYDFHAIERIIATLLSAMTLSRHTSKLASSHGWTPVKIADSTSPNMANIRHFARLRGIELPYQSDPGSGRRTKGLCSALRTTASIRPDRTILVSDMNGVLDEPKLCMQELARVKRGGRHVIVLAPHSPKYTESAVSTPAKLVAEALEHEATLRLTKAQTLLAAGGVPLVALRASDGITSVVHKINQARTNLRQKVQQ